MAILPNKECDRTQNGPKCPSTHDCVVPRGTSPPPLSTGVLPVTRPPPLPPTTARGVCYIHVDFATLGFPPPPQQQ
ncbi:unnamed protein product [Rotaria magnacalcarata]|uniref:Uncharacterized protein n=1 Tax=Rotaria magnacalcarata TaxID=392030 RepID=A0A816MBW6_9BILA|nr:unnamed protein product [Rotaria magnacalcarata]CAF1986998.1 unnamed protein product [Rotaria magnacalcarata]CAF2201943.1 unnamed protein product [Rotaria magnacalcarata]